MYIMADRYRGTMYVGVTSDLLSRVHQHRQGTGSEFCAQYGLTRLVWAERGDDITRCIEHEKRLKRWRRAWKFELIERANPDWQDLIRCCERRFAILRLLSAILDRTAAGEPVANIASLPHHVLGVS